MCKTHKSKDSKSKVFTEFRSFLKILERLRRLCCVPGYSNIDGKDESDEVYARGSLTETLRVEDILRSLYENQFPPHSFANFQKIDDLQYLNTEINHC